MISIIVAKSENSCIGIKNKLPWHLSEDLKHFKKITEGHKVIMGRKTFESILDFLGKPLPNRENIVITRNKSYNQKNCTVVNSLEEAINLINSDQEAFIIGGAEIYNQAIKQADKLYITEVKTEIDGDKFFPELDKNWLEISREYHTKDEKNKYDFDFVEYIKNDK